MSPPGRPWRRLQAMTGLRLLYRALRSREGRGYAWLRITSPEPLFQDYGTTSADRYPSLFGFVQESLSGTAAPRLLSFGCSTGEEAASLRRYFPDGLITGLDIHPGHIATCCQRLRTRPDPGMRFRVAGSTAAEADAAYDAVFCLAVLRRGDLARHTGERCDHLIRFEDFDAQLEDFARCLRPGGLLVLRHSNFRLRDAGAARWFEPVLRMPEAPRADTPLFGPDNRRLREQAYGEVVFRRLACPLGG
ncbi:class I SAM-dependent methyltransferase [Acidovorax cattleyae]|nr:class I SAM-dependent methyltransferase [Paracidovorax cattleyae]MBF9266195.1 class I SAM-dependent methyltransferase [Paracidovorax cattleyae]